MAYRAIESCFKYKKIVLGCVAASFCLTVFSMINNAETVSAADQLKLSTAILCEDVQNRQPQNAGVVFSISSGQIYCYTLFDPVPEQTTIYHNWYSRDTLTSRVKLQLQPPRWTTYSTIQLRESDKGPWRVEITDASGKVLQVLRFSVTE